MDNYLTKLSKIEILWTNIGHGQNLDKHWTKTGQNLYICQKIVQILSNPPILQEHPIFHRRCAAACHGSDTRVKTLKTIRDLRASPKFSRRSWIHFSHFKRTPLARSRILFCHCLLPLSPYYLDRCSNRGGRS